MVSAVSDRTNWLESIPSRVAALPPSAEVMYPAPFVIALLFKEIFAEPSKETPAMVRAVASFVAVAELPVILEDID